MNTARSYPAALLALALLSAPAAAAQDAAPETAPARVAHVEPAREARGPDAAAGPTLAAAGAGRSFRSLPAPRIHPDAPVAAAMAQSSSLSRHVRTGAGIGAVVGAAFGLAVVSFAGCGGPDCGGEKVVGVAVLALTGAATGALVGAAAYLVRG